MYQQQAPMQVQIKRKSHILGFILEFFIGGLGFLYAGAGWGKAILNVCDNICYRACPSLPTGGSPHFRIPSWISYPSFFDLSVSFAHALHKPTQPRRLLSGRKHHPGGESCRRSPRQVFVVTRT